MTQFAFITTIEEGSSKRIVNPQAYFNNALTAIDYLKDVCDYSNIRVSEHYLSVDALMDRVWNQSRVLKAIGRCKFSVLGWTDEHKLVWICVNRVELKGSF